jgi:Transcriptional regulator
MDAREQIIETALRLVFTRGCKATTMDEVASEAGISKRTLYEQFEDKEHLLAECIRWSDQKGKEAFEVFAAEAENVIDLLLNAQHFRSKELHKMKFDFFLELKRYYPQVFKETIEQMQGCRKEHLRFFFVKGQEEGLFLTDINVDLINDILETIIMGIHENGWKLIDKYSPDECFKGTIIYFIRGLCTEKGIKYIDEHKNV